MWRCIPACHRFLLTTCAGAHHPVPPTQPPRVGLVVRRSEADARVAGEDVRVRLRGCDDVVAGSDGPARVGLEVAVARDGDRIGLAGAGDGDAPASRLAAVATEAA